MYYYFKVQLTSEQRVQAIILLKNGFASREIAIKVGCKSHTTISRLKKKYEETGKVENKPGSGRPRKLNERDERSLIRRLMTKECTTAVQLQKSLKTSDNIEVSTNTVHRALKRNSLVARVKRKKQLLSKNIVKTTLNLQRDIRIGQ